MHLSVNRETSKEEHLSLPEIGGDLLHDASLVNDK
jgi:hypothetical protein